MSHDPLAEIRSALNRLRRQNGVQPGDAFDHILRTVEALGVAMAALSLNAKSLIEEGQREVGAVVSAAMTRQALWRLALLPAAVGGGVALVSACTIVAFIMHNVDVQRMADRSAQMAEFGRLHDERAAFQTEIAQQRADLAAEKKQVEDTLPGLLLIRADRLAASARELAHLEVEVPGLIDWVAQNGRTTMAISRANGGSLCPRVVYEGPTAMCIYPKP